MALQDEAKELDIKGAITMSILTALGFLVAFQWRDVIQKTIDTFMPTGEGLLYQYFAAIVVTIIAVIVMFVLFKLEKAKLDPRKLVRRKKR